MKEIIQNKKIIEKVDDFAIAKIHIDHVMNGKKIKKILFVNPPDVDENIFDYDVAKRGRANNYPSYGIGILAAQLRKLNYDTEIINLNHEILKEVFNSKSTKEFNFVESWQKLLSEKINNFQPDIIGVSCLFSVTHESFKKVCKFIKKRI